MAPSCRSTLLAALVAGCAPSTPLGSAPPSGSGPGPAPCAVPAPPPALASASGDPSSTAEAAPSGPAAQAPTSASSAPLAASSPSSSEPAPPPVPEAPALFDEAGELLPQTQALPSIDDGLFQHRLGLLWHAIVADDPEIARPFFFPKAAYLKVKGIADPGRDWERRLWKLFVRDVHAYHAKLGDEPDRARLLRLDFPHDRVKWMKKHSEGNVIGYHRIKRPHLVFTTADGRERRLEITAMISWRGHWHVVHLHGFK